MESVVIVVVPHNPHQQQSRSNTSKCSYGNKESSNHLTKNRKLLLKVMIVFRDVHHQNNHSKNESHRDQQSPFIMKELYTIRTNPPTSEISIILTRTGETIETCSCWEEGLEFIESTLSEQEELRTSDSVIYSQILKTLREITLLYTTEYPPLPRDNTSNEYTNILIKLDELLSLYKDLYDILNYKIIWFGREVVEPFIFTDDELDCAILCINEYDSQVLFTKEDAEKTIHEIANHENWSSQIFARIMSELDSVFPPEKKTNIDIDLNRLDKN